MGNGIKPIKSLEINLVPPSYHLGLNKFGWERIGLNVKLCSMFLKLNFLESDTLIVAALDIGYKSSFTFLENYGGGVVNFKNRSLAWLKGKDSIAILSYPKLDGVLYVKGLKAYLLRIGQMCDKDYKVNFYQELCEVVNEGGKIVIIGHKTMDNCYAINLNSRTPLVCSKAKLDPIELWHRRLGHINYRDLVHLVNTEKVRGNLDLVVNLNPFMVSAWKTNKLWVHTRRLRR